MGRIKERVTQQAVMVPIPNCSIISPTSQHVALMPLLLILNEISHIVYLRMHSTEQVTIKDKLPYLFTHTFQNVTR